MTIALSGDRSIRELTELADKTVRVQLERVSGVGEVRVVGGLDRAINVWIDAERLAAYQIPVTAIRTALTRQNADVPGGNVNTGREELVLAHARPLYRSAAFEDLVIANVNGSPIRLRDVGRVEDGTKEQRSLARLNGVPTVTLEIRRQSGANTIEVINGVKAELPRVTASSPATSRRKSFAISRAISRRRCTKLKRIWSSAASSPAWSCCSSCARGARR